MRRHWFPTAYAEFAARLRVPGGFVLVAAFLWLSAPAPASLMYGLPVAALGLWLRGWAAGHLEKNQRLATGGPYAHLRNPLYLGSLLAAAGLALASRSVLLAGIFAAVFPLIYLPVIEREEQYLRQLFPDYDDYAARVPWLWPLLRGAPDGGRFQWKLYRVNEEYQALAAFLAGVAVLFWKAWRYGPH